MLMPFLSMPIQLSLVMDHERRIPLKVLAQGGPIPTHNQLRLQVLLPVIFISFLLIFVKMSVIVGLHAGGGVPAGFAILVANFLLQG